MISSNLVFSKWDRIFKDPMTTAAAIDRIVHRAIILECTNESYRGEVAKRRNIGTVSTREALEFVGTQEGAEINTSNGEV